MKKSAALYLSAREACGGTGDLAGHPLRLCQPRIDPLGTVVGFAKPSYRAEDIRNLKERRTPSPEPRGLRSFDADLPVMDSAIATITEDGPIYRGVNCIELAENRHTRTCRDVAVGRDRRRSVSPDNCPLVSAEMRAVAAAARDAAPIDRTIAVLALAASADPRAFTRAADGRAMVGGRILRLVVATMLNAHIIGRAAASPDRQGMGAGQQARRRFDPPRAGAAGRS